MSDTFRGFKDFKPETILMRQWCKRRWNEQMCPIIVQSCFDVTACVTEKTFALSVLFYSWPCFSSANQLQKSYLCSTKATAASVRPNRLKDVIFLFNNFISQSLCVSRPVRPWTTWGSWPGRCSSRSKSSIGALTPPPFPAALTSSWSDSPMAPCSALLSTFALERWESYGRERKW